MYNPMDNRPETHKAASKNLNQHLRPSEPTQLTIALTKVTTTCTLNSRV